MLKRLSFSFVLAMVILTMTMAAWAAHQVLTVQVREIQMRTAPSFTGRPSATLSYGQTVSVLEEQGIWVRASGAGGEGWVHRSALTDRRLELSSGARNVASKADDREVAAAGKGFTAEIERAYRQSHQDGYAQMEAMLRFSYSPTELYAFLSAGKLVSRQEASR